MSWVTASEFIELVELRRMQSIEDRRPSQTIWAAVDWEMMVMGEAKSTDRAMGVQE